MVYVHDGRSTSPQRTQGYVQCLMSLVSGTGLQDEGLASLSTRSTDTFTSPTPP
jgi:hypothetical protein